MFGTLLFQRPVRLLYFIHVMVFAADIANFSRTVRLSTSEMHNGLKYIGKYSLGKSRANLDGGRGKTPNNNAALLDSLGQYLEPF